MAQNRERRNLLLDSAIEVLARDGARGLTFRAVDAQAKVPKGTASNYFASRADLLNQVGERIHLRLTVEPSALAEPGHADPDQDLVASLMQELTQLILRDRTGYLALMELRLEATRRPELRTALTRTIRANLERNIQRSRDLGLPGDDMTVLVLYLAISGLAVEQLTLPGVLFGLPVEEMVDTIVRRSVPTV